MRTNSELEVVAVLRVHVIEAAPTNYTIVFVVRIPIVFGWFLCRWARRTTRVEAHASAANDSIFRGPPAP
jgi:hypothetical protein